MKKLQGCLVGMVLLAAIGCSGGEKQPVEGDNPNSANSVKATTDQVNARGNPFPRTNAPPGSGRVGGNVMEPPKGK
jgi:hypothetical protein